LPWFVSLARDLEKGHSLLSFVPFSEARVKPNPVHLEMEAQGTHSSAILVRGNEGTSASLFLS
jgi:hypothetical protein